MPLSFKPEHLLLWKPRSLMMGVNSRPRFSGYPRKGHSKAAQGPRRRGSPGALPLRAGPIPVPTPAQPGPAAPGAGTGVVYPRPVLREPLWRGKEEDWVEGTGTGHLPAVPRPAGAGQRSGGASPAAPRPFPGAEPLRTHRPPRAPPAAGPASLLPASPFLSPPLFLSYGWRSGVCCSYFGFGGFFSKLFPREKKKIGRRKTRCRKGDDCRRALPPQKSNVL
uniref:Uncharacterized protein n=1 Tax=Falco tinnunculus TaxID=100819 RepID=A0A8C4U7Y5_FALTI